MLPCIILYEGSLYSVQIAEGAVTAKPEEKDVML